MDLTVAPQSLSELAASFLQGAVLFGLAIAFAVLYQRTRKPWFAWWTLAWTLYGVRIAAITGFLVDTDPLWLYWHQVFTGWVGLALLWAALVFSRGTSLTGRWYLWGLFPVVWSYFAIYQLDTFLLAAAPAVAFLAAATGWTAWTFARFARQTGSAAARFLAIAVGLWAVHHLDYPFLRARGAWDPWGYYLDIVFALAVGGGCLLLVIEDQRRGLRVLSGVAGALQVRGTEDRVLGGVLQGLVGVRAVRGAAFWDAQRNLVLHAEGAMAPLAGQAPAPALAALLERAVAARAPAITRGTGYTAALPVLAGERVSGALLISGEARDPFAALDTAFLTALSRQVAAALENAALDRRLTARTGELERLAQRMLRLHEDERRRLSRELHDETAQFLSALKMELGLIKERVEREEGRKGEIDRALGLVTTGIRSIRSVTAKLRPTLLDDLGLVSALRALVADFQRADGLAIALRTPEALPALSGDAEVAIFRAVQEGLSNVVRHARARSAAVTVEVSPAEVRVQVADDGVGPATLPAEERMGLAGMRERVAAAGGTVRFGRADGRGALLEVRLPRGGAA